MQHVFTSASADVANWRVLANAGKSCRSERSRTLILSAHTDASGGTATIAVALVKPQNDEILHYEEVALTTSSARRTNFANDGGGYFGTLAAAVSGNGKVDIGFGEGEDAEWRIGVTALGGSATTITINAFFDTEV